MPTSPAIPRDTPRGTRWLLTCGLVAPVVLTVSVAVATAATPDYSHLSETVSQLGAQGRQHALVMQVGFVVYGLLISALAIGLRSLSRSSSAKLSSLLLALYGGSVLLTGLFQDGPNGPNAQRNLEDALHGAFGQMAFFAFVLSVLSFARAARSDSALQDMVVPSLVVVVADLVLGLLFLLEAYRPLEGLVQRLSFGISLAWIVAVSLRSRRLLGEAEEALYPETRRPHRGPASPGPQ